MARRELKAKLGPILWQFPPMMAFKPERFEPFLAQLPHDTEAAAEIAAHHDHRVEGRMVLVPDRKRPLRHAVEIRHDSFIDPAFVALLRRTASRWSSPTQRANGRCSKT